MTKWTLAIALVIGCSGGMTSTDTPRISGDSCEVHADQTSCAADSTCTWFDFGRPCQDGSACQSGECQATDGGGGGSSGGGSSSGGGAACACPGDGVCFEQIGGPAEPAGGPTVECTTPAAGSGDPCSRIQDEGTCTASMDVTGLCLCDNGER